MHPNTRRGNNTIPSREIKSIIHGLFRSSKHVLEAKKDGVIL